MYMYMQSRHDTLVENVRIAQENYDRVLTESRDARIHLYTQPQANPAETDGLNQMQQARVELEEATRLEQLELARIASTKNYVDLTLKEKLAIIKSEYEMPEHPPVIGDSVSSRLADRLDNIKNAHNEGSVGGRKRTTHYRRKTKRNKQRRRKQTNKRKKQHCRRKQTNKRKKQHRRRRKTRRN